MRHQLLFERLKTGMVESFVPYYRRIVDAIRQRLSVIEADSTADMSRFDKAALISDILNIVRPILEQYENGMTELLASILRVELQAFASILGTDEIAFNQAWTRFSASVVPAVGAMPLDMVKGIGLLVSTSIIKTINRAYADSLSVSEMRRMLVGDAASIYGEATMHRVSRSNLVMVETVAQHLSQAALAETGALVGNTYTWCSLLDAGTTLICRDRNGNTYQYGKGPLPPAHYACRSFTVPGDLDPTISLTSFLRNQTPELLAVLTSNDGLSVSAFADMLVTYL